MNSRLPAALLPYEQALNDYGITPLLDQIQNLWDYPLAEATLNRLAKVILTHCAQNLSEAQVRAYLWALQDGQAAPLMTSRALPIPPDSPAMFLSAQPPRFEMGAVVQWVPFTDEEDDIALADFGIVMGRFYGYASHSGQWLWCYLIYLDPDAPSARWCSVDTAWENDLERLEEDA
ncbi:hypothetical protein [Spirulina major]|uniref:hypothetical protein n=1 Tax=Spirulina major TaxID=270636 RepID=UPI001C314F62|nr:hypothetical protein [Spirulina major]